MVNMACLGLHSNADDSLKRLCCLVWFWFVVIIFTHNYIIHFHHCNRVTSIIISKFVKTCILGQPVKVWSQSSNKIYEPLDLYWKIQKPLSRYHQASAIPRMHCFTHVHCHQQCFSLIILQFLVSISFVGYTPFLLVLNGKFASLLHRLKRKKIV